MSETTAYCCEFPAMLRVRPRVVLGMLMAYVRYECPRCGEVGALSITEDEAARLFDGSGTVKDLPELVLFAHFNALRIRYSSQSRPMVCRIRL